jgi:multidrug resistance efflux pump
VNNVKKHKKVIFIVLAAVLVVGATLGAVAFAQADDQPSTSANTATIWDRVVSIFKQNTGTTINADDLKTAFDQAQQQVKDEALDNMLQKLVDSGKITQAQADAYKAWLNSKPTQTLTDEYKQWLQSRPQDMPFGGPATRLPALPRGFGGFGGMFRR